MDQKTPGYDVMEERVQNEKQRLTALLFDCGVSDQKISALDPVLDNVAWMRVKLDDTREDIKNAKVVIAYDNGGGQKGLRENPLFKGYASLWKSYMNGIKAIMEVMPQEMAQKVAEDKPKTVLELIREKHRA